jgi:twitching motility protein PilJ
MPKNTRDDMLAASLMEGRKSRKTETFRKDKPAKQVRAKETPDAQNTNVQRSVGLDFFRNLRQRDQVVETPAKEEKLNPADSVWQEDEDMDWAFVDAAKTVTPESEESDKVARSASTLEASQPDPDDYAYHSDTSSSEKFSHSEYDDSQDYSGIGQGSLASSQDESVIALANAVAQERPEEPKKKAGLFSFFKNKAARSDDQSSDYQNSNADALIGEDKPKRKGLFDFFKKQPAASAFETGTDLEPDTVDLRSEMAETVRTESKLLLDKADAYSPYTPAENADDLLSSLRSTAHDAIDSMIASKWSEETTSQPLVPAPEQSENSQSFYGQDDYKHSDYKQSEFGTPAIDDEIEFAEPAQSKAGVATSQPYNAASRHDTASPYAAASNTSQAASFGSNALNVNGDVDISDDMDNPVLEFDPVPVKAKDATLPGVKKTNWDIDDEEIVSMTSVDSFAPKQTLPNAPKPKTAWDVNDDQMEVTPAVKTFDLPEETDFTDDTASDVTALQSENASYDADVSEAPSEHVSPNAPTDLPVTSTQERLAAPSNFVPVVTAFPEQAVQPGTSGARTLNDIPVGQKLAGLIALLLLALGISALTSFLGFRTMRYQLYNIYEFMLVPIVEINRAGSTLATLAENYTALQSGAMTMQQGIEQSIAGAEAVLDETVNNYDTLYLTTGSQQFTNTLRNLGQLGLQEREVAAFTAFKENYASYKTLHDQLSDTNSPALLNNVVTTLAAANTAWTDLLKVNDEFAALSYQDAVNSYRRSLGLLFTIAALGLGTSIILGTMIVRSLTGRLRRLTEIAEGLQRGSFQSAPTEGRDEIGQLGQAFNGAVTQLQAAAIQQEEELSRGRDMQQNIGQFLDVAQDIAQGDLTKRGEVTNDVLGNVVDAINLMTEEFALLLKDVQVAADSVNQGSSDVLVSSDDIAEKAQRQAAEAQRAKNNVVSVVKGIRWMAQNAATSAEAAQRTLQASQLGQQAVSSTLRGMQTLRQDVQSVSTRVQQLGKRSQEISSIVETISDIASQTNLLALGAALEAAGAGESGRRFSVVADEVGTLAERAAQAAGRVSTLLASIQREVAEVTNEVNKSSQQAEQGYQVATQAGQRLAEIADISQQSAMLAETISQASSQQVENVEGVGSVIQSIAGISQESQQTVLQGRAAAERLRLLAESLNDSLSRFRLNV